MAGAFEERIALTIPQESGVSYFFLSILHYSSYIRTQVRRRCRLAYLAVRAKQRRSGSNSDRNRSRERLVFDQL